MGKSQTKQRKDKTSEIITQKSGILSQKGIRTHAALDEYADALISDLHNNQIDIQVCHAIVKVLNIKLQNSIQAFGKANRQLLPIMGYANNLIDDNLGGSFYHVPFTSEDYASYKKIPLSLASNELKRLVDSGSLFSHTENGVTTYSSGIER